MEKPGCVRSGHYSPFYILSYIVPAHLYMFVPLYYVIELDIRLGTAQLCCHRKKGSLQRAICPFHIVPFAGLLHPFL